MMTHPSFQNESDTRRADAQVEPAHYRFNEYCSLERWSSYWTQLRLITNVNPRTVLYVGVGDGVVPRLLRGWGIEVHTFDFDPRLAPDIVGDVRCVGSHVQQQYDVVVCCQVLEHLEFRYFRDACDSLSSVTRQRLVVSLPVTERRLLQFDVRLPKLPPIRARLAVPAFWLNWKFNGEHYWEVGAKHTSKRLVRGAISHYIEIEDEVQAHSNPYHLFFCGKPKHARASGTS